MLRKKNEFSLETLFEKINVKKNLSFKTKQYEKKKQQFFFRISKAKK